MIFEIKLLKQITKLFKGKIRRDFYIGLLLLFLGMILEFLSIYLIFPLIDFLKDSENIIRINKILNLSLSNDKFIVIALLFFAFIYVVRFITLITLSYILNKIIQSLHKFIFLKLYEKFQSAEYEEILKIDKSDLINLLQLDLNRFTKFITSFFQLFCEIVLIIGILFSLFIMKPIESFVILTIVVPLFYLGTKKLNIKMIELGNNNVKFLNETTNNLDLTHDFYKEIKIFNLKKYFRNRINLLIEKSTKIWLFQTVLNILPRYFIETLSILCFLFYLIISISFLNKDFVQLVVEATVLGLAAVKLLPSLGKFTMLINDIKFNKYSVEIILNRLKRENSIEIEFLETKINNLCLKGGDFKFGENQVIKNADFNIEKGERFLIKGRSGSGKSTLINIILGFYSLDKGEFKINGLVTEKRLYDITSIGYVSQHTFLFNLTLNENIILNKVFDNEKLQKVIDATNLRDLYIIFGDKDKIGINGNKLSGGQKQRLSIARALYQYTNILVLDEATSSLDHKTESKILHNIFNFDKNSIIIFSTHNRDNWKYSTKIFNIE